MVRDTVVIHCSECVSIYTTVSYQFLLSFCTLSLSLCIYLSIYPLPRIFFGIMPSTSLIAPKKAHAHIQHTAAKHTTKHINIEIAEITKEKRREM